MFYYRDDCCSPNPPIYLFLTYIYTGSNDHPPFPRKPSKPTVFLASHRQTIIFSSDDSQSLHIIVCYYWWGQNYCWEIRTLYRFKTRNNRLICNWIWSCAYESYQSKSRKNTAAIFTGYGRPITRPMGPCTQ